MTTRIGTKRASRTRGSRAQGCADCSVSTMANVHDEDGTRQEEGYAQTLHNMVCLDTTSLAYQNASTLGIPVGPDVGELR
mmetsp:Transcript_3985/g.11844  ORF Transcript_3985/g.11844 Transcript_3985/m.11844 type:complete len:80 (-) Transcript_3985:879-1118(-)